MSGLKEKRYSEHVTVRNQQKSQSNYHRTSIPCCIAEASACAGMAPPTSKFSNTPLPSEGLLVARFLAAMSSLDLFQKNVVETATNMINVVKTITSRYSELLFFSLLGLGTLVSLMVSEMERFVQLQGCTLRQYCHGMNECQESQYDARQQHGNFFLVNTTLWKICVAELSTWVATPD
jgi:hypothetical protein